MSSELVFRKGSAELLAYTGSSKMYEALNNYSTFDKWSEVSIDALYYGLDDLKDKRDYYNSQISKYEEALNHLKNAEDIYDALDNLEELKDELKETSTTITELKLIIKIQNYVQYEDDNGEKVNIPLEWKVC